MARFYDTMLAEYIKNPGIRGIGLDKLSTKEFNYMMISYDSVTDKAKINFKDVDLKQASIYSGEDVYITNKLYEKQVLEGTSENSVLTEIEIPLLHVLKEMEISGVKINRDKLKEIGILLENEISRLEKNIYEIADTTFNINSPKQVGDVLFEKLALPKGKKTKTGYSVGAEVLGELAFEFEIAQMIVDYRHYSKLLSTYINGLSNLLDENDFLHTNYSQTIAATGRLSSINPNLQNIPNSNGIAGTIREAFISRFDNGHIMTYDYSQVEVRILAILSNDENLLGAFENNLDIHHKTAEFLFPNKVITSNERKIAKAVNFGVIYGISSFGLSKMIGIPMKDAKVYIDKFFESYPKVRIYLDEIIKNCEENKYVETYFGRKRYINGINDLNRIIKSAAEREATNMPIQGTSADIIKLAMIETQVFLEKNKLKSLMIMQVHDELVFDVFPGEEEILKKEIPNIMENILKDKTIKLKVDFGIGKNWREAK
ncbi:MAG: DNA polymerase [Candidatus Gracilibacteria bacterium]|nr:DNA polymerase [Candidatus Gracilibacteria bacterium]